MAGIDINRTTNGVALPAEISAEIWGATVENSAVMSATRQIRLPGTGVTVPLITGEPTASWVDETDEKPVSRHSLSSKVITPYKLAVIEPFSNEFVRDLPGLYRELVRRLPSALGRAFDSTVFGETSAPGSNFDSLGAADAVEFDAADPYASLAEIYSGVAAGGGRLSGWIASPTLQGQLMVARDTNGSLLFVNDASGDPSVGRVLGAPVYTTNVTEELGFAGDFQNGAVWGSVEGVKVRFSDQATLTDGDASINLWQRNMVAVLAEIEVGFRVKDLAAFRKIAAPAAP